MEEMTDAQRREILDAIESGKKLEAIKLYREATGSDLADAKNFIEGLQEALATGNVPESSGLPAGISEEEGDKILRLLQAGKKIEAIKIYREATGTGLKAAKEAVEAMAAERGIASGGGCGSAVLLALVIAVGIWWF